MTADDPGRRRITIRRSDPMTAAADLLRAELGAAPIGDPDRCEYCDRTTEVCARIPGGCCGACDHDPKETNHEHP